MHVIGLTGGTGTGKTTVSQFFSNLNIPVVDADLIAHALTAPLQPASEAIIAHFGDSILLKPHTIDRKKLRARIFKDETARRWLEQLLHPLVIKAIIDQIKSLSAPYCIVTIPLLFETGPYDFIERTLVVDMNEDKQIERIIERDHISRDEANAMIATQMSREKRLTLADDIISNNTTMKALEESVQKLHQRYLSL